MGRFESGKFREGDVLYVHRKITSYHILCTYYACKNFNVHPCHLVDPQRSGLCSVSPPCVLCTVVSMPNMRVRRCLGPEGNGVSSGEGVREGQAPEQGGR